VATQPGPAGGRGPVGMPPRPAKGRRWGRLGNEISYLRHEGERRTGAAMTASLGALGDDDVGAAVDGALRIGTGLQLAEHRDARRLDVARKGFGIVER